MKIESGKNYRVTFECVASQDRDLSDGDFYGSTFVGSRRVNHTIEEIKPPVKTFEVGQVVRHRDTGNVYLIQPDNQAVKIAGDDSYWPSIGHTFDWPADQWTDQAHDLVVL